MVFTTAIYTCFNIAIDGRHYVSNFESDSSYFDQIFLKELIAWKLHFWALCISHDAPDFLFRLLF